MRKFLQFILSTIIVLLCTFEMYAQQRTVTGKILDENNQPLIGVTINVKGTERGVVTNASGSFSIRVSKGETLEITHVGYETKKVIIGESNSLEIILKTQSGQLEEVMITAEFGLKRLAKSVGSSAQTVRVSDITESGRGNFISALQGRVSGLNVSSTSGAPGASTTVVLRNVTSISGNNQPLYVIDGVPMNNSTYDPLNSVVGGSSNELWSVRNLDFSSRGNDFNPEDIESLTVLKGAAAAALYGSDASNGAIVITTKKGRAGKGRVSYNNMFKWDQAYGYPDMQNKYANGNYGVTNYYNTSRFGGLYPGSVAFYDNIGAVLQTGFMQRHNLSVEGGSDKATIRASGSFQDARGVIKTTSDTRINLSINGQAQINQWLKFEGSMQYANTGTNKALRGTDGPLYRAMLWPIVDDMSMYLNADGSHMKTPDYYIDGDLLNPLYGLYKNKFYDKSDRFLSNVAFTLTPTKKTFLRAQLGWDVGTQTYTASRHPYYAAYNNGVGNYNLTHDNFSNPTVNILAGYNNKFFDDKFSFSAQVGYHQLQNGISRVVVDGSKFIITDMQSINNTDVATQNAAQRNTKRRIQAVSGQFEFGYKSQAFLTFRGRNDWSSTLPVDNNTYFYPAVEGSVVLSDIPALKSINKVFTYLKLRGAVARVGKDANPLAIDPQLIPTNLAGGGFRYDFTGPNKNLVPEMNTSKEIGFELRAFKNRLNADFTYYRTRCENQIVNGFRLSYATGFVLNNMNVGSFSTHGWEAHIDGDILKQNKGFTWNLGLNASRAKSMVDYLPENVTEYYNAYTWNSGNLRNGIMRGYPVTTITGLAYLRNSAGQKLIDPTTGLPIVSSTWSVLGDREPKLRFGITNSLSYKAFTLTALFEGRYKATVINGTKRSMMSNGTSWESVDLRQTGPYIFNGVLRDGKENSKTPTVNTISVDYRIYGASIYGGNDEDWVDKNVNYLRLREARLNYRLPASLLGKTKVISSATAFVSGNDLLTWTNYTGIDAVGNTLSAAAGGTGGEGYDIWSLPNPRGIAVGVMVNF
jgi:TonB-linked SusC/RagA family outer membrane protein